MSIKLLPNELINQIAAGEIIHDPYSIVKEIVENSIDAGSNEIFISIDNGGKSRILVTDNGIGMSPEDMKKSIKRHYTSKEPNNLYEITTLGFRGEALFSITQVANVIIKSKIKNNEYGYILTVDNFREQDVVKYGINLGTEIEVRGLFHSIPARLRFLKSDLKENKKIEKLIRAMSIYHKNISFKLISDNKQIFHFFPESDLCIRATHILDIDRKNLFDINYRANDISINGFASLPTANTNYAKNQYIFVNGRYIINNEISASIASAYKDYIPHGAYPIYTVEINIDPYLVDVNVHPSKTEVKFRDVNFIKRSIFIAFSNELEKHSHKSANHDLMKYFKISQNKPENAHKNTLIEKELNSKSDIDILNNISFDKESHTITKTSFVPSKHNFHDFNKIQESIRPAAKKLIPHSNYRPIKQMFNTFILAEDSKNLIIVDQHAAHERIVYEKMKKDFEQHGRLSLKNMLIPIEIKYTIDDSYNLSSFEKIGFKLTRSLTNSVLVNSYPSMICDKYVDKIIIDLLEDFTKNDFFDEKMLLLNINRVFANIACKASIKGGTKLSFLEMSKILHEMKYGRYTAQCNHGRPTYIKICEKELRKLFERT